MVLEKKFTNKEFALSGFEVQTSIFVVGTLIA